MPADRLGLGSVSRKLSRGLTEIRLTSSVPFLGSKWAFAKKLEIHARESSFALVEIRRSWAGLRKPSKLLAEGEWAEVLTVVRRLSPADRAITGFVLVLAESQCFIFSKLVPHDVLDKAADIMRLEFLRTSPFGLGDVCSDYFIAERHVEGSKQVSRVTMVVAKKIYIDPIAADLSQNGLALSSVVALDKNGLQLPINLVARLALRQPTLLGRLNTAVWVSGSLAAAAALLFLALSFWRQHAELQMLATELEAVRTKAAVVRKRIAEKEAELARISGLRLQKLDRFSTVQIWEELTAAIPGTTWLTSIRVDGEAIEIDCLAKNASELIPLLSGSGRFARVEFSTPVTRDPQSGFERFQIRMTRAKPATAGAAVGDHNAPKGPT